MSGETTEVAGRRAAALEALAAKPDGVLEAVAEAHGLPYVEVLGLLPEGEAVAAPGEAFEAIWSTLGGWGEVLFLVHGRNGVFEIRTALPPGTAGQGWFNIHGETPLGGHLKRDRCRSIWFVDRLFFGRRSLSIQFVDVDGETMFKVFVARGADRALDPRQTGLFEALRAEWSAARSAAS